MITFPWFRINEVNAVRTYTALIGLAELRSITVVPTFVYYGALIDHQVRRSPAVVGYRTALSPLSLHFYHLSVWQDRGALHQFIRSGPHRRAMDTLDTSWLGKATFSYWEVSGADLPLKLSRELFRLGPDSPGRVIYP